jgi:hypothetical protein
MRLLIARAIAGTSRVELLPRSRVPPSRPAALADDTPVVSDGSRARRRCARAGASRVRLRAVVGSSCGLRSGGGGYRPWRTEDPRGTHDWLSGRPRRGRPAQMGAFWCGIAASFELCSGRSMIAAVLVCSVYAGIGSTADCRSARGVQANGMCVRGQISVSSALEVALFSGPAAGSCTVLCTGADLVSCSRTRRTSRLVHADRIMSPSSSWSRVSEIAFRHGSSDPSSGPSGRRARGRVPRTSSSSFRTRWQDRLSLVGPARAGMQSVRGGPSARPCSGHSRRSRHSCRGSAGSLVAADVVHRGEPRPCRWEQTLRPSTSDDEPSAWPPGGRRRRLARTPATRPGVARQRG